MKPVKEDNLGKTYREQFKSKCKGCEHLKSEKCGYSGASIADVQFEVAMYFGLDIPCPVAIMCPVFAELKRGYDEQRRQVPVGLALERARRGVGQRPWVGEKLRSQA